MDNCLQSLANQSYRDFEVVLVDNASIDNSVAAAREVSDRLGLDVKFIALPENKGFTGGNIEGLKHASGKFIALLNPDTEADSRWLEELVKAMNSRPDVGIVASKLIVHNTDIIDTAGDGFSSLLKGFKRGEGENASLHNRREYIFGACAGAALYRKEMLDEIGFLDDDFFLIHEDTDLNLRAHLAGWKVLYAPTAIVYHKVRSLIGYMSDTAVYYTIRNKEFVIIKNIAIPVLLRCLPILVLGVITEFFYFAVRHRRPVLYFKAKLDALKMFPPMLKKRRAIMRAKKAKYRDLMAIMTSVFEKSFFKSKLRKLLYD